MTARATRFRPALMDRPFQEMTLMHSPPMLYRTAARKTNSTPSLVRFSVVRCVKNTPCPVGTEGDETRYHLCSPSPHENGLRESETHALYRAHPSAPTQALRRSGGRSEGYSQECLSPFHQPGSLFAGRLLLLFLIHTLSAS